MFIVAFIYDNQKLETAEYSLIQYWITKLWYIEKNGTLINNK